MRSHKNEDLIGIMIMTALFCASGCNTFVLTKSVRSAGVETRRMEFRSVEILSNGDLRLKGALIHQNGFSDNLRADRKADSVAKSVSAANQRDVISMAGPFASTPDAKDWHIVQDEEPKEFIDSPDRIFHRHSIDHPFPYLYGDKTYSLKLEGCQRGWIHRAVWSYPSQVLLVPAVIIDSVLYYPTLAFEWLLFRHME